MSLGSDILLAAIVAEIAALGLLTWRNAWRSTPWFCALLSFGIVSDITLQLILMKFPGSYARYYVVDSTADSLLQFVVFVELAWSVLKPVRQSLPRQTILVVAVLIALAGLAIWPLAGATVPAGLHPQSRLIFHLDETFAILRVACFVVMASFSQLLSIGWRDRELQIATGFGIYSIVSLLVELIHSHQAQGALYHYLDLAESLSYLGALLYWVGSFAAKEQERKEFSPQMRQLLLQMSGGVRADRVTLSDLPDKRSKKRTK